jgi:hypothetical protein
MIAEGVGKFVQSKTWFGGAVFGKEGLKITTFSMRASLP